MAVISRGRWHVVLLRLESSTLFKKTGKFCMACLCAVLADKLHHRSEKENRNLRAIALVHAVSALENHTQHSMNLESFCLKFRDFSNEFRPFHTALV